MTTPSSPKSELKPCPFCGVIPIPELGKVLYELHHKPLCFLGGRIRFGCSELERWNTRTNELSIAKAALTRAIEEANNYSKDLATLNPDEYAAQVYVRASNDAAERLTEMLNNLKDIDDL